ncbi:MAG: N-acetylneuraminate synthase family protein [Melioribacteraceae bacterium]|nr:N-acetylneuraminate synthase family protein [Melioribacteraceae bacterium]MCF8356456.1 N-acetylneuraminate synthase family protein [Melioribacteraceae bacterium]MCF8395844.1 N-acetylneuraminate synthase family protein [Melioribacteraceae bacterium]MCF8420928.1 N-acetylneuraminate synthase family protein [Melioribacteraceae bacterium]
MSFNKAVKVGDNFIGDGHPVYIIAEIGINHNGSIDVAKKLIDGAVFSGCDAVKFQKRTPELCVPKDQWNIERDTPWGRMTYIDYRHKIEFGYEEYAEIDRYCKERGIHWFVSPWDEEAVDFIEQFDPFAYKIASASLTDNELLSKLKSTGKPVMLSTGMSTLEQVDAAVELVGKDNLMIAQSTSNYPCKLEELNIKVIKAYKERYYPVPVGYSGHETGLSPTFAAVALGANFIERHITLDRAMWGSDQAASVEIQGFFRLVENIRDIEKSLGNGIKTVYESELKSIQKLRRSKSSFVLG